MIDYSIKRYYVLVLDVETTHYYNINVGWVEDLNRATFIKNKQDAIIRSSNMPLISIKVKELKMKIVP